MAAEELSVEENIGRYMMGIIEADLSINPMFSEIRKLTPSDYLRPFRELALAKNPTLSASQLSLLIHAATTGSAGLESWPFLMTHHAMTEDLLWGLVCEAEMPGFSDHFRSTVFLSAMMNPLTSVNQKRRLAKDGVRLYSAQLPNALNIFEGKSPRKDPTAVMFPTPMLSTEDLDLIVKAARSGSGPTTNSMVYRACLSHPNISPAIRHKEMRRKGFWDDQGSALSAIASNPSLTSEEMMDILIHVRESEDVLRRVAVPLARNSNTLNLLLEEIHKLALNPNYSTSPLSLRVRRALTKNQKYLNLNLASKWGSPSPERKIAS